MSTGLKLVQEKIVIVIQIDIETIVKKKNNTMTTRGIRRKKSSLSEVKIGVLGAPTVGKSGMHSLNIFFLC